jgi:CheY-like chemotaxis protein
MIFVVVEDDFIQAESIREALESFEQIDVIVYDSEAGFESALPQLAADPPGLIILDIRVRAASPTQSMFIRTLPPTADGAGQRCLDMLLANDRTRDVDVILYSSLWSAPRAPTPLPRNVRFQEKEDGHKRLLLMVGSIFPDLKRKRLPLWRKLLNSISIRLPGVSISLDRLKKK